MMSCLGISVIICNSFLPVNITCKHIHRATTICMHTISCSYLPLKTFTNTLIQYRLYIYTIQQYNISICAVHLLDLVCTMNARTLRTNSYNMHTRDVNHTLPYLIFYYYLKLLLLLLFPWLCDNNDIVYHVL